MGSDDRDPLPFVHGALPRAFRRWQVVLTAGAIRPYDPAEWRGALVVVQGNELELVCREGRVTRLHDGAVGFLAGLPLALLRNPGPADLRLVAVARRADEFCAWSPSLPPNDPNDPHDPSLPGPQERQP